MQHQWIGPGVRILLGLLTGGLLVIAGYAVENRGTQYRALSRALTGGGAALFYFTVFAAHSIYHLINWPVAGLGLILSAAGVLALAAVYESQAVAVLGVLGAFITPLLIGGNFESGTFALVFVAAINVPVILLGLRRKWQALYNLAFFFTIGFAAAWLERELPGLETGQWKTGLFFVVLFYAEFAALGLLKLKAEPQLAGRTLDLLRLAASTCTLLGALYWILSPEELDLWMGTAFLLAAAAHLLLARFAWTWAPRFKDEILAFLLGALTCASLALPAQLDGAWVSLGWAIEGALLAFFALRIGSGTLQSVAIFLGLLGLGKSLLFDFTLYPEAPASFLNGRFATGMLSAGLLGVQGWLHGRSPAAQKTDRANILFCAAVLAALAALFVDAFATMNPHAPWPWLVTTCALAVAGLWLLLQAPRASKLGNLGILLLVLVPPKLLLDVVPSWTPYSAFPVFFNLVLWIQLLVLAAVCGAVAFASRGDSTPTQSLTLAEAITGLSLLAGVLLVTVELYRSGYAWARPGITLWWALCAMGMATAGIARKKTYLRYIALALLGAVLLKVFLVDLAGLSGLHRIAAFMGVGVALLLLSFLYQRVAPRWTTPPPEEESAP